MRCMGCGKIFCVCHSQPRAAIDYNKPVPPSVIQVAFRSDARRIADLEKRYSHLLARIEVLERVVAGLEAVWGEHIERPHITFALPLRGTVTWGYRDCNGDYRS